METLIETYHNRLAQASSKFVRYLAPQVNWNSRLFAIIGARGSGKTTLLLQHIRQNINPNNAIYISLDDLYFSTHRLIDTVKNFRQEGVTHFFIDEIHKYPYETWAQELKNIYDTYPDLKVVFSGSSVLNIYKGNADLSRRAISHELFGLSFREFLEFEKIFTMPAVDLETLLKEHVSIARDITNKIKILPLFRKYLQSGYFPYYREDLQNYHLRLLNTVNAVLEIDLPSVEKLELTSIHKLKRLLAIIAGMTPFTPNMSNLSRQVDIQRSNLPKYLVLLERANLICLLRKETSPSDLRKPSKIFLDNPNLAYALGSDNPNIGNLRETFFYNQLKVIAQVTTASQGDFLINEKYLFEVGGKGKTFSQIAGIPDSFLAVDELETGFGAKIPLWMFGLLY